MGVENQEFGFRNIVFKMFIWHTSGDVKLGICKLQVTWEDCMTVQAETNMWYLPGWIIHIADSLPSISIVLNVMGQCSTTDQPESAHS